MGPRWFILAWCLLGCAEIHPGDDDDGGAAEDAAPGGPDAAASASTPDGSPAPDPDAAPGEITTTVFDAASIRDTYLRLNNPTLNYGGGTRMCADTTTDDRRILLRVDVSSLAAGVEVESAELHIWTGTSANDLSTQIYSIYPMLESWTEGNLSATAGVASWNQRATGTAWTTAGAGNGSRGDGAVGSFVPDAIDTEYTVEVDAALVQGWIDDAATNQGVTIVSAGEDGGCFDSSEFTTASKRPSLSVSWRAPPI